MKRKMTRFALGEKCGGRGASGPLIFDVPLTFDLPVTVDVSAKEVSASMETRAR